MFGVDDAIIAAAVSAGGNMLGGYFANQANSAMSGKVMNFNDSQARQQRQWQEYMSGTAYQRVRKDLENAGLNPILAAGGSGASTPSGASAQGVVGNPRQNIAANAAATATQIATMKANLDLLKEQKETMRQQGNMYGQQANLNLVNMNNAVTQGEILVNQVPASALQAKIDKGDYGLALAYAKRLGIDLGSAMQLVKTLFGGRPNLGTTVREEYSPITGEIHRASRTYTRK